MSQKGSERAFSFIRMNERQSKLWWDIDVHPRICDVNALR